MNVPSTVLEQALQLTAHMLAAARAQQWEQLVALEAEREPLLLRQHGADATAHAQLGELLARDRELQALVRGARDAVAVQWQRENSRAQAIHAYAQNP